MKRRRARSPNAIELARSQRATANEFASTVWQWVRNRQVYQQKFRREYPIPPSYRVLRIWGYVIRREGNKVLELIGQQVEQRMSELENMNDRSVEGATTPHPRPLSCEAGRGETIWLFAGANAPQARQLLGYIGSLELNAFHPGPLPGGEGEEPTLRVTLVSPA